MVKGCHNIEIKMFVLLSSLLKLNTWSKSCLKCTKTFSYTQNCQKGFVLSLKVKRL